MTDIDFDARYRVATMPGVAWYLVGWGEAIIEHEWPEEGEDGETLYLYDIEPIDDKSVVKAVMVGDDREHVVDVDDLTVISDDEYCSCCGQIGCPW